MLHQERFLQGLLAIYYLLAGPKLELGVGGHVQDTQAGRSGTPRGPSSLARFSDGGLPGGSVCGSHFGLLHK